MQRAWVQRGTVLKVDIIKLPKPYKSTATHSYSITVTKTFDFHDIRDWPIEELKRLVASRIEIGDLSFDY